MRKKHVVATGVILLGLFLAATAVGARGDRPLLVATGNELTAPGSISPGRVRCIGGQPTGNPIVPCTPGTRLTMIRGMVSTSQPANMVGPAAEWLDGTNRITNNCNLDVDLRGQCWGTFEWAIPGKAGRWEGTWTGRFDIMASSVFYSARAIGRGGDLDGRSLAYEAALPGWSATPGVPNMLVFLAEVRER